MSSMAKNHSLNVFLLAALLIQYLLHHNKRDNQGRSTEQLKARKYLKVSLSPPPSVFAENSPTNNGGRGLHLDEISPFNQEAATTTHQFSSLCAWAAPKNSIQFWTEHFSTILAASQMSLDEHYRLQSVTARVLEQIMMRLPRSVKTLPTTDFSPVIEKLERRYRYLQNPDSFAEAPPPVIITILGGSVTIGNGCYTGIKHLDERRCAWPARLDQFIHNLVQSTLPKTNFTSTEQLATVQSLAIGATNTALGQFVIKYDLWPEIPDIVINSYSTNDNHGQTLREARIVNLTLRDKVFTMNQDFVRTLHQWGQCTNKTVVLFWLDDYLGNFQREILVNYELTETMQVLSNYYGFGFMSYADMVRDAVYSNTMETTFSPSTWYNTSNPAGGMREEVHPGQGMHMATAWLIAYNLFSTVVTHCSLRSLQSRPVKDDPVAVRTFGIPPLLTKNLTLDVVSELWRRDAATVSDCGSARSDGTKRCPISWVSGMPFRSVTWIQEYFECVVQLPLEWHVIDDTNNYKVGWVPLAGILKPKLVMEFNAADHAADNIHSITLFFLKSYGPKWNGSTATVMIEIKVQDAWVPAVATLTELTGTHDKKTSENYAETIHLLQQEAIASAVRLTLTLTGGKTFKLMGIAVCQ